MRINMKGAVAFAAILASGGGLLSKYRDKLAITEVAHEGFLELAIKGKLNQLQTLVKEELTCLMLKVFPTLPEKLRAMVSLHSLDALEKASRSDWFYEHSGAERVAEMMNARDEMVQQKAVKLFSSLTFPEDVDPVSLTRSCSESTLISLARYSTDSRFFNTDVTQDFEAALNHEDELKDILTRMPLSEVDTCTKWFTQSALMTGKAGREMNRTIYWSFGGDNLSFAESLSSLPAEQAELYYLEALARHSQFKSHRDVFMECDGLSVLRRIVASRPNSLLIQREVASLLGNVSLDHDCHKLVVNQGWLPVLLSWRSSQDLALSCQAVRILANLDHSYSSQELYDHGVYLLHPEQRPSDELLFDVVFIHGIRGGPFKTWRQGKTEGMTGRITNCWPKSWLVKDFPALRVLLVEYETVFSNWLAQCPVQEEEHCSVESRSESLLMKLDRAGLGKRPIVWVTHSLGGLLVKQLLLDSFRSEKFSTIFTQTRGLVFFSAPHRGSSLAKLSKNARYILLPTLEVKELSENSPSLQKLHEQFLQLAGLHDLHCLSFGESEPTEVTWLFNTVIVPPHSADPGLGEFISVPVNHVNICKPTGPTDQRYIKILQFIRELSEL